MCLGVRVSAPAVQTPTTVTSLTSLRAFAALLVFLFHAQVPWLAFFTDQGRVGVSFFFLLSGLLLGYRHRPGDTAGAFYRRRAARIYPAYLVALLAGAVVSAMSGEKDLVGGLPSLVLLQAWVPDVHVFFAWNSVSWSLSVEAFFYACFPFIAPAVLRLGPRGTRTVQVACVLVVAAISTWGHLAGSSDDIASWATYILPVSRLAEFVLGLTLVSLVRGRRLPVTKVQAVAVFLVCYLLAGLDPLGYGLFALTLVPIALVLVVFSQADLAGERSFAHLRPLVVLGEWSYCFYLVHQLALRVAGRYVDGLFPLSVAVVALPLAVVGAWLLHVVVEKPMDARLNGRTRSQGHGLGTVR